MGLQIKNRFLIMKQVNENESNYLIHLLLVIIAKSIQIDKRR